MLESLAKRQPGSFLTTYVDVLNNPEPRGGLTCLFQTTDGKLAHVHESELVHYERLYTMLTDERFKSHPLVQHFAPNSRIELLREWGAVSQARRQLKIKRDNDPYAGLSPQDVALKLFKRLRSGVPPNSPKKPDGPN